MHLWTERILKNHSPYDPGKVQAEFLSPAPLWSSRWEHTLPDYFTSPITFLPHLPFQAASKREREKIWGPTLEEMDFIVLPLLPQGGYCLLPKPGFLRKVGGEKGKGASRSSRKIEKKEVVLQKPYFLIYMIRWQMNWARLKICFLETFNTNFILEKKNIYMSS